MPSLFLTTLLATAVSASLYPDESSQNHTCAITNDFKALSCSSQANITNGADRCCVETAGGLILSTQTWITASALNPDGLLLPSKTWTLHGLWPNFCNGSNQNYCDPDRQYDPVPEHPTTYPDGTKIPPYTGPKLRTFIESFGKYDLLAWMKKYWLSQGPDLDGFWGHEISKHGTCFSTFEPSCYGPKYQKFEEVIDFYETAISYYKQLPTYFWLQSAGITPSNKTTYSLSQIENALSHEYGAVPYLGCVGPKYNETAAGKNSTDAGATVLLEIWYQFYAYGRPQAGKYVPADSLIPSTCAKAPGAIHYYERTNGSEIQHSSGP